MHRFIEGTDRSQVTLFPDRLEDWIDADNPVRVIDAFIDALDLNGLRFVRATAAETTAISTGCSRAVGSSAKPDAMSK